MTERVLAKKKQGEKKRIKVEALPPDSKPIPDTFEFVVKALVKPVVPKMEEEEKAERYRGNSKCKKRMPNLSICKGKWLV